MAYIRHKVIKGHVYYYLVEGHREGKRVRQKVLKYLGKQGTLSASSGVAYRGFVKPTGDDTRQSTEARQRIKISKTFKALGFTVRHNLSGRNGTRGRVIITRNSAGQTIRRSVSFIKNPPIGTMSHELGHAIDYHLRDKANSFWASKAYRDNTATIQTEFENVGKDKYHEALERQPSLVDGSFFQDYVFTKEEGYANAFELFLTDYKKAMRVVPNMVAAFHDMIRADEEIRKLIEALDVWQLEETEDTKRVVPNPNGDQVTDLTK